MAKHAKIIREIKKNIKITEIKKEEEQEQAEQKNVPETLEEIAEETPSSMAFPRQQEISIIPQQTEDITTEARTETEEKKEEARQPIYQVQNVTQRDLEKVYETNQETERKSGERTMNLSATPREEQRFSLDNEELKNLGHERAQSESHNLKIKEKKSRERKMPWEE